MDQSSYSDLTGEVLSTAQAKRFATVSELAKSVLEEMLGWPLDPEDWSNQYVETGKSKSEFSCFSLDRDNLDDPDEVVGSYRLYPFNALDRYQRIDPALAIHAVKVVNGDVTCKTFDPLTEYNLRVKPGTIPVIQWIDLRRTWWGCGCEYFTPHGLMLAVDADWAFVQDADCDLELPLPLQQVWADLIRQRLDLKINIKSESITSHSYTKFDAKPVEEQYGTILREYVGPLGSLRRPSIV